MPSSKSEKQLSTIKEKLVAIMGQENVDDTMSGRLAYSYDATPNFQALPDFVVSPRTAEEVAAVLKLCSDTSTPLYTRGSGTNLCADTCPIKGGVVLLMKHLDKILELDKENLTITVQPGTITKTITDRVEQEGLFYPPDPSSMKISTIGGNLGENSGGLRGLKYGVTKDYVMALQIALPNGELIRTGGKLTKDVAGYDLTHLFVGSEGTLGVITEATLKLIPKPESQKTILALYQDIEAAGRSVSSIIAHKMIPVTLEFLDQDTLKAVEDFAHIGLPTDVKAILLIVQDGPKEIVDRDIHRMAELCREEHAVDVRLAASDAEAEELATARRSALSALARLKPTTILEDATVPRSEIATMVRAIAEVAKKYKVRISTFGHAGDGNLHPTCLTDARDKEEMERVEAAFAEIFEKAIELGGTLTGEHGVGVTKAPYLEWKLGHAGIEVMKGIKQSIDPNGIMNPGKVFSEQSKQRMVMMK
ncbi:FAD-linked oxidase C-terminal domain-containing protein [Sporolactobacillus kofuensis]|uniref:FAD-linked oxidase C-terminal domain-containing protein n=1 Tax=Sporolactobacillus kofuensis TaxID=269672 RepID=A0ABW1WE58_9BACL|nr:FAD-linked oxidase C-terminal domain-containing protein [Sporolactobacillus kofuensis]MCO7175881.1 FAD-binding protein [Sporolactobacillus kofuensis]